MFPVPADKLRKHLDFPSFGLKPLVIIAQLRENPERLGVELEVPEPHPYTDEQFLESERFFLGVVRVDFENEDTSLRMYPPSYSRKERHSKPVVNRFGPFRSRQWKNKQESRN